MTTVSLSQHDINVLEKIKDPESNPAAGIVIDSALPRDPQIVDHSVYERVVERERTIIRTLQAIEMQLSSFQSEDDADKAIESYKSCVSDFGNLISDYPLYASARNNRAQIMRRLYGDGMLLNYTATMPMPLIPQPEQSEKRKAANDTLEDMETAIRLLTPSSPSAPMSAQAARTLSMAHTQRAAIYLRTAKLMSDRQLDLDDSREEATWSRIDFEEAASRDLALGGRYGNQIAKALAVSVNPTAKLCGQMVREAMKKEYGPAFEM
ncbi:uncharacterized protein TRIVIDRAFT_184888 [Trichoderma virens Gv29-8]|uniref:Tetratricopeptide repeat protein 36 n=1 Tax=Hypocrea virens (strain Gv29-8 / FGSC 10586) TaxID=413071 RepID=G9NCP5_HYPVG|nr:uncharacterized protein TRIVIDRAFT_184888 [Trichoderma virens Gv29-8]EHK15467.1 hypothetical protein TRIVIDRAFT_184888 [Trichoderma virens Gv29-8]UKZ51413.1 hypothetical protein TrVGV298_005172 [Trichoderma virens]